MTKDTRTRVIIALVGIAIVIVVGSNLRSKKQPNGVHRTQGTITMLDAASRTASIEFVHPKSGQRLRISGEVPADCEIRIDGNPATLADLKVGEQVQVEGTMSRDNRVTAKAVWVTRTPTTASAPAATTRPAGVP